MFYLFISQAEINVEKKKKVVTSTRITPFDIISLSLIDNRELKRMKKSIFLSVRFVENKMTTIDPLRTAHGSFEISTFTYTLTPIKPREKAFST